MNHMANNPILSVCVTVFNQFQLLKKWLDTIYQYKGNDIEIIVSDNNSTDGDIRSLIKSYKDIRMRYCPTDKKGHDLNIINAIEQANGRYIYLFRTRDYVLPNMIDEVIKTIKDNPNASYFIFSALYPNGKPRMLLPDKVYRKGKETTKGHDELLIHPSGSIYNKDFLRPELYEKYQLTHFDMLIGFTVHQLMRMDMAANGDFVTSSSCTWVYANTLEADDVASNISHTKKNIYSPVYQYQRYKCEFDFANQELSGEYRLYIMSSIICRYFYYTTFRWELFNSEEKFHIHYNSMPEKFNYKEEIPRFKDKTNKLVSGLDKKEIRFIRNRMKMVEVKLYIYYPLKRRIKSVRFLRNSYYLLRKKIKGY